MEQNKRVTEKQPNPAVVHRRPAAKKRKKMSRGRITITVLVAVLLVASLLFLILMGRYVWQQFSGGTQAQSVDLTPFKHTDAQYKEQVSYYVLGILGDDEQDPDMQMLSLVCHDKQKNALSVLQIPRDTYLDDEQLWGQVHKAGQVFSQPKPYDWCDACKQRLYQGQIASDGRHTVCGVTATQRTGSAVLSLMDLFNDQLGMPVDHYFLLPQQAFIKLVDLMNGITLDLKVSITVGDLTYTKGVQTVDGEAALFYMTDRGELGVQGDLAMLERQRAVLASVLNKLFAQTEENYRQDTLFPIQQGSTPIRSDLDKEPLLSFVMGLRHIAMQNITVSQLPGTVVSHQSAQYYSADRDLLLSLLNASFNPVGPRVTASDIRLPELTDTTGNDPNTKTLAEYLPPESQ